MTFSAFLISLEWADIWNKLRFEEGMIQKWLRLLVKSLRSRIFSRSIWAQKWLVWTSRTSGNRVRVNDSFSSLFRYLSPLGDEIWKNFIWWLQSTFSPRLRFWHSNTATNNFRFLVYFESKPPFIIIIKWYLNSLTINNS